jgi:biopolymer transport protein ExbB
MRASLAPALALSLLALPLAAAPPARAQAIVASTKTPAAAPAPTGPAPAAAPVAATPTAAEGDAALLRAYRREYAYLADEEAALRGRIAEVEAAADEKVRAAEGEVASLEARLAALEGEVQEGRARLRAADEREAAGDDGADAVEATVSQALASLERHGVGRPSEGPEGESPADRRDRSVRHVFAAAAGVLARLGTVREAEGAYFLADGREERGRILHVGAVGAIALDAGKGGPLAPAGGGRLKLSRSGAAGDGAPRALDAGASVLAVYLFESLEKAADEPVAKSLAAHVTSGGPIAWVIVALGAATALLLVLRTAGLLTIARDPRPLLDAVVPLVEKGRDAEALALARGASGSGARVVEAALAHPRAAGEALESLLSDAMLREGIRCDRFDAVVSVAAAVAPLLGLLGTVTGMIGTFDVITLYGTGDPKLLSGGISEALITTELGLAVAIPALLWGNLLGGLAEKVKRRMESAALRIVHLRSPESGTAPGPLAPEAAS